MPVSGIAGRCSSRSLFYCPFQRLYFIAPCKVQSFICHSIPQRVSCTRINCVSQHNGIRKSIHAKEIISLQQLVMFPLHQIIIKPLPDIPAHRLCRQGIYTGQKNYAKKYCSKCTPPAAKITFITERTLLLSSNIPSPPVFLHFFLQCQFHCPQIFRYFFAFYRTFISK